MSPILMPYRGVWPTIAPDAFVAPGASVIGDVVIGPGSSVWFGCAIRGDVHEIRIGADTNIQDGTVIHVTKGRFGTYIGDGITIGHKALIHACTLEDGCFIGMGAVVMDGCVIESGAMVAAGALVTPGKRVKAGELWAGSPAKLKRPLTDEDTAGWPAQAEHYAALGREYREDLTRRAAE
ncbi:gamma carbonic anhydrase family protein [Roseospira marina]|uniref:Gamma carbonic anhydrase family protein n=1 Tax=Roseospira marina TaxID=140057 RepID=A0A5M6IIU1_9PROT|nr:gamma carbonic anhydrase family protein [Roseospira marina]KAA5607625.1 gamma carbonic anhydrase family protein [Roseospira marina]MBB4312175.1 carbonic anhydrase/acetyltransferase-like protein (isoleucine patch superfamily) [Roseospira marina]MBB5085809.1 carbonic anhydrase/acetyltransferase-like protein (isoleucine patch superfamily) [Roseospira marina]